MRLQTIPSLSLILVFSCGSASALAGEKKPAAKRNRPTTGDDVPLRFELSDHGIPSYFKVIETSAEGAIRIAPPAEIEVPESEQRQPLLKTGYFLAAVQDKFDRQLKGSLFVRVQITAIGKRGQADLTVGKNAVVKIETGTLLMLFPSTGVKPADWKRAPESAVFEEGEIPDVGGDNFAKLVKAAGNLALIGVALHSFHDQYHHLPPAVLVGPDGKPWHSWRVLLLPFLDENQLYDQYQWNEPWDGPNNKKLIEKMPSVFADPTYGDNKEHFTHFVAITGDGMAFAAEGAQCDGKKLNLVESKGRERSDFIDGLSNTLVIGPAGPDRRIPWTKPEDITIGNQFPGLGEKDGFPLPFKSSGGDAGLFLRGDGMAKAILGAVDNDGFRSLLTISGGEGFEWADVPCVTLPDSPAFVPELAPAIRIDRNDDGTYGARLVLEPAARPAAGPVQKPPSLPPGPIPKGREDQ